MDLRLNRHGDRLHLMSFAVWQRVLAAGHVQPVVQPRWDVLSARAFLRQHFQGPGEMHLLRAALADDIGNQSRMSDDAILGAGSQRACAVAHGASRPSGPVWQWSRAICQRAQTLPGRLSQ
jgi:hypothetical protein